MNKISRADFPVEQELINAINAKLLDEGIVVVSDFCGISNTLSGCKETLYNICKQIGLVTSHNGYNTPVWDISPSATKSEFVTFSEHANEAEMHTDSVYKDNPEDFFALHCVKKANCGGGLSTFLSVKDIVTELTKSQAGIEAIGFFENNLCPFLTPDIFKIDADGPVEYVLGHILNKGEMRFRIDAIEQAFNLHPELFSDSHLKHFEYLKQTVLNSKHIKTMLLQDDECLFINNKKMLHGRTDFKDQSRHLLRIRFNKTSI